MFDLERMKKAVEGETFRVPSGLNLEQMKFLLLLPEDTHRNLQFLTDENMKASIRELMVEKKVWDSEILEKGGISFIKDEETNKVYKVSMTNKSNNIVFKWRVKNASGQIFSVCSKTSGESQKIVNKIYGKNKYTVSMMLL